MKKLEFLAYDCHYLLESLRLYRNYLENLQFQCPRSSQIYYSFSAELSNIDNQIEKIENFLKGDDKCDDEKVKSICIKCLKRNYCESIKCSPDCYHLDCQDFVLDNSKKDV